MNKQMVSDVCIQKNTTAVALHSDHLYFGYNTEAQVDDKSKGTGVFLCGKHATEKFRPAHDCGAIGEVQWFNGCEVCDADALKQILRGE